LKNSQHVYLETILINHITPYIKGQLSIEGLSKVLENLRENNQIEWCDKLKKRCFVYWRTPEEWGTLIYKYISDNGMTNTVCTFYELTSGDDVKKQGNTKIHFIRNI
jgi:ESCRT-II complex subunit VPS25